MSLAQLPPREKAARLDWADIAKGVSIILLVFWHTNQFHPALGFLRMPLFFFVSGLFAFQVISRAESGDFLKNKIGGMIYLYVLWALLLILLTRTIPNGFENPVGDIKRWMQIFWYPPLTLWFIYALAISFLIARLLFRAPFWIVFAASVLVYLYCGLQLDEDVPPLPQRIGMLFPFFWMGLYVLPLADRLVARYHRYWPLVIALYLVAASLEYSKDYPGDVVTGFVISWIGIAGVALFGKWVADMALGRFLVYIGSATLYIYLMHRIVLFYLDELTAAWGWNAPFVDVVKVAIIVVGCAALGKWAHRTQLGRVFTAPWLRLRGRATGTPQAA